MTRSVDAPCAILGVDSDVRSEQPTKTPTAYPDRSSTSGLQESGFSSVRSKFRTSAKTYQRTLDWLNGRSRGPVALFQMKAAARDLGISEKSVQRDVRGMELDGLVRTERQRRRDGMLSGYRLFFLKRPKVSAPSMSGSSLRSETEKKESTGRRPMNPAVKCAQRLIAAVKVVDYQKLRRVRTAVLRAMLRLEMGHDLEQGVKHTLSMRRSDARRATTSKKTDNFRSRPSPASEFPSQRGLVAAW